MASCCLSANESIYDVHLCSFTALITNSSQLWRLGAELHQNEDLAYLRFHHSGNSITDLGAILQLFFTALKCRHRYLRRQAIGVLGQLTHKEGIWDAQLAACVAREVVRIEEADFYDNTGALDDFSADAGPAGLDLELPVLPESYRARDVRIGLPEDPFGTLSLSLMRRWDDGRYETIRRDYSLTSQCWRDGQTE